MPSAITPNDSSKQEYVHYFEQTGVLDAVTSVLIRFMEDPDRPEDALEYIRKHLGNTEQGNDELEAARARIAELEAEIARLKEEAAPTER